MRSNLVIKQMEDYEYILTERFGFHYTDEGCCKTYAVPKEVGNGTIRNIFPCENAGLSIIRLNLRYPLVMQYDGYNSAFETTCCFSGHIAYSETGVIDTCLSPNELGIYTKQNSRGMMMYPAGEHITAVSLFGTDAFKHALPLALTEARSKNRETAQLTDWLMEPKKAELPLIRLFRNIIDEPVKGVLQPVFYEGITKTLLTLLWQHYVANPVRGIITPSLSTAEYTAVLRAHDILSEQYADPPTIPQLARRVFLNETRLKQRFKELFGKTIHQFTHEIRMRTARSLLENKTVSETAYAVGYVNVSHFSQAFRKFYGRSLRGELSRKPFTFFLH